MDTETSVSSLKDFLQKIDLRIKQLITKVDKWLEQNSENAEKIKLAYNIAHTAFIEMGIANTGGIALLIYLLPQSFVVTIKTEDPQIEKILEGIKGVETLNTRRANIQSENFMKLLLLLAKDMQALLAVLGIKIWQLRNFSSLESGQKEKLLSDFEHLYLPLVHRLGLYRIKAEIEDFVMSVREPEVYRSISKELEDTELKRHKYIEAFISPLKKEFAKKEIDAEIKYRIKTVYSIWKKMKKQQLSVSEVPDVIAIRIIDKSNTTDEKRRCWEIYSLITDLYPPDAERLRDWVSLPRANGYESLHTTVRGADNRWVEVQIRTERMDRMAEEGPAAHWRYKEGAEKGAANWLLKARQLLETAESDGGTTAITDEIFTLTPNGDIVKLKEGATVLDFAFAVHTQVGLRYKGATVNGKIVPIKHKLLNSDRVEIHTSKAPNVSDDWLKYVVTLKAKNRIKKSLQESDETNIILGRELLERKLKQWKTGTLDESITLLMRHFKSKDAASIYRMISAEKLHSTEIYEILTKERSKGGNEEALKKEIEEDEWRQKINVEGEVLIINDEMATTDYQVAKCCNPVYGDSIFGFVTVSKGIKIHRTGCPNAVEMIKRYPYRVIKSKWEPSEIRKNELITINVTGRDRQGVIRDITELLAKESKVAVNSANFTAEERSFTGAINIYIGSASQIGRVVKLIQQIPGVEKVTYKKHSSY